MSFFDSKEEVLDIQLTQYGKLLYSKGKFKPHYYAFFDDDIIYDSQYASLTSEPQNQIESRVQEETPYIKTIASFIGCETNLNNLDAELYNQKNVLNYTKVLGTSDLDQNYSPSWNVQLIKGNVAGFTQNFTASSGQTVNIPQISTNVVYEVSVVQTDVDLTVLNSIQQNQILTLEDLVGVELQVGSVDDVQYSLDSIVTKKRAQNNYNNFSISPLFSDGTSLLVEEKSVLLDISELNTQLDNDIFEVEVFKYDKDAEGKEVLKKLSFKNNKPSVVNNILLDEEPLNNTFPTNEYVEYYLNIFADNEIDSQVICDFITPTQKTRNTMASVVTCDDNRKDTQKLTNSLYTTTTKPGESC